MTGPEHYAAAERLLANRPDCRGDGTSEANQIAAAQVHATLAAAAATALRLHYSPEHGNPDLRAWSKVASERVPETGVAEVTS